MSSMGSYWTTVALALILYSSPSHLFAKPTQTDILRYQINQKLNKLIKDLQKEKMELVKDSDKNIKIVVKNTEEISNKIEKLKDEFKSNR